MLKIFKALRVLEKNKSSSHLFSKSIEKLVRFLSLKLSDKLDFRESLNEGAFNKEQTNIK